MLCRFELYEWPDLLIAELHPSFETRRVGIVLEPSIEPPEKRANMRSLVGIIDLHPFAKILFAQRYPNTPNHGLVLVQNGNFKASANEEPFFIDDTIVASQFAPFGSLVFGDCVVAQRSRCAETGHSLVDLTTPLAQKFKGHWQPTSHAG